MFIFMFEGGENVPNLVYSWIFSQFWSPARAEKSKTDRVARATCKFTPAGVKPIFDVMMVSFSSQNSPEVKRYSTVSAPALLSY